MAYFRSSLINPDIIFAFSSGFLFRSTADFGFLAFDERIGWSFSFSF